MKKLMIQRLVKDLRCRNFSWEQIKTVLACIEEGPYSEYWLQHPEITE